MTLSRKMLCYLYGMIAVIALIGSWSNVISLLQLGPISGTVQFWKDTLINESSRFITVDILFLALAVTLWMVLEARRIDLRGVWFYIVFGALIAICVAVPLFMIHRERCLAATEGRSNAGYLSAGDIAGLVLVALFALSYAVAAFLQ